MELTTPKVSIIIPVYNVQKYLYQCLESVINQTLEDIEIICVNDCSTDDSLNILKEYSEKDIRIVIIDLEENRGQGYCRNIAIDKASGDYIMFLDSDDWLDLDACELAYNQISQNQNDFVIFPYYEYDEYTENIKEQINRLEPFYDYINLKKINPKKIKERFFKTCYTWTQIYDREFLNKNNIRYSNHRLSEDIALYIKSFLLTDNIAVLNRPIYYYRKQLSSSVNNEKLFDDVIETRKNGLEIIKKYSDNKKFQDEYIVYAIRTAINYYSRFVKNDISLEKEFYFKLKDLFRIFNKELKFTIKDFLTSGKFRQYSIILHLNYYLYKYLKNIKNIIYKKEKKDYYTIFQIFRIKIKCKNFKIKKLIASDRQLKYLKSYIDNTRLKPAMSGLRKIQKDILNLAKEVTSGLEKNNINYFITDGTLIGAIRHKGFIPWDDDFDMNMMREDFVKFEHFCKSNYINIDVKNVSFAKNHKRDLYNTLSKALKQYPNKIFYIKRPQFIQIFRGNNLQNFVHLDISPLDFYKDDYLYSEHIKYLKNIIKTSKTKEKIKDVEKYLLNEIKNNPNIISKSNTIYDGIDCLKCHCPFSHHFIDASKIFPLKKIKFEDSEFFAPNNPEYAAYSLMGNFKQLPEDVGDAHHLRNRIINV